jgi:tRNA A-37 threonylcarbamoyl transferase component Bud32
MRELTAENANEYLIAGGWAGPDEPAAIRELSGGVSNVVLLVELPERGERFAVKQARGRLRVQEEWLCPIERIWREVETLQICGELLKKLRIADCGLRVDVPEVLWEDRENYCFAMTAAPPEHTTWKELLLAGDLDSAADIARTCGKMLATLHGSSWGNAEIASRFDDRTFFDLLRIDPYYRHGAKVHPDLTPQIQRLIDSVWSHRQCLVHGDFSPKNLLVWQDSVMLIDCEVGHYGDPAFDLGFFMTHLMLKSIWRESSCEFYLQLLTVFWNSYRGELSQRVSVSELGELECRTIGNLAGCMLARVDGKSPVDYLAEAKRKQVRDLSRRWLAAPPDSIAQAATCLAQSTEY